MKASLIPSRLKKVSFQGSGAFATACCGFSLIEVTIAMAVIGFAVTTIMALLPTGLGSLQRSMSQTVETQIVRGIGASALVSGFDQIASSGTMYFNDEGQSVGSAGQATYSVTVLTNPPVYPGSGSAPAVSNALTRARVVIAGRSTTNTHTLILADSGKSAGGS